MKWETYLTTDLMKQYYVRPSDTEWLKVTKKWMYKEFPDHVVFGVRGPYLPTLAKRLPPQRVITIHVDRLIVGILEAEHFYILDDLREYAEELQNNKRTTGKFDVANTPHIFN